MGSGVITDPSFSQRPDAFAIGHNRRDPGGVEQHDVAACRGQLLLGMNLPHAMEDELAGFQPGEAHSTLIETASGKRVPAMQPRDHEGHVLKPAQAVVKKLSGR